MVKLYYWYVFGRIQWMCNGVSPSIISYIIYRTEFRNGVWLILWVNPVELII